MLEFVNLSGPEAGKDQQTRRKVRSQAMRDFRRRQRAENERKRAASPQAGTGRRRERVSNAGVPTTRDHSQARLQPPTQMRRTSSRSSLLPTQNFHLALNGWDEGQQFAVVTPPLQTPDVFIQQTTPLLHPSAHGSPSLSSTNSQAWSDLDETFESQEHVDQMFDYCKSYLDWLCPGIDATTAAGVLSSRQDIESSPTVLAALCLASVGHLDAARGSQTSLDYALYKARVFRNINDRMKSSVSAVSDETVGYLACLLSYEMSNCNRDAVLHLQGLQGIIKLKGGLSTFSEPLAMMLECLDLCHALMFDEQPILATSEIQRHNVPDVEYHLENCMALFRLLRNEAEDYHYAYPTPCPYRQRLEYLPRLLQDGMDVIEFLGPIPDFWKTVDIPDEVAAPYRQRLEQARSMGLEADPKAPDAHYLARIVYLRILLMYNLDVLRIHPDHPSNQSTIDGLWDTVRKISEQAWEPLPYMRLWVLLAGATLAQSTTKKSFFMAHLVRCVFRMGTAEWPRVKSFIIRFLSARSLYLNFLLRIPAAETYQPRQIRQMMPEPPLPWTDSRSSLDGYIPTLAQADFRSASVPLEDLMQANLTPQMMPAIPMRTNRAATVSSTLPGAAQLDSLTLEEVPIDMGSLYSNWQ